ncbi:MAG: helix-turn-helix transcriptional regulator [Frankiaceae bacterium]|nr:helix-turn-helix transcriptional regulator [Frankiaceae bacterium]MBV9872855.1 helix-turn-helix transcriptional regulator [Frankiaceae bacterium]
MLPPGMANKLWAAADLFAAQGADRTSVAEIAAATGIPKATLYYHSVTKEVVLAWIFRELLGEVEEVVVEAAASDGPAPDRLRAVLRAHLALFHRRRAASAALQFDLGRAARSPQIRDAAEASFIRPVSELIAEGIREGTLVCSQAPRAVALALLGAVNTTGIQLPRRATSRQVAAAADDLADLFLKGLSP